MAPLYVPFAASLITTLRAELLRWFRIYVLFSALFVCVNSLLLFIALAVSAIFSSSLILTLDDALFLPFLAVAISYASQIKA